jgi:hypothetical protein
MTDPLREALEWIANRPTNWQNEKYVATLRDRARAALREAPARDDIAKRLRDALAKAAGQYGEPTPEERNEWMALVEEADRSPSGKERGE